MKNLTKLIKVFLYILPLTLFFSYYPIIHFGENASMNFELSLPLIWLILFDILTFCVLIKKGLLFKNLKNKWPWLLFPIFLTISILWSLNSLRGLLTVGILWLIYFAAYAIYNLRDLRTHDFQKHFLKYFFISSLSICFLCFLQCILDLVGVSREYTLMCEGCTYLSFGFPHPNGFAIEPQFLGNLLLAPTLLSAWILYKPKNTLAELNLRPNFLITCLIIFTITLFLTFSRGAIYAFLVAIIFLTSFFIVKQKNLLKKVGITWLIIILSFFFTLNLQGIMAEVSKTNDTYKSGVAKVLNHLSLGIIDIREPKENSESSSEETQAPEKETLESNTESDSPLFDGYVAKSTDIRIMLNNYALSIWSKSPTTIFFGVGLGGAGTALYENDLLPPNEIIQNQYISLLLETGLIGISLLLLTLVLIIHKIIKKSSASLILSLIIADAISLLFFAGLPNALQIYLIPTILFFVLEKPTTQR